MPKGFGSANPQTGGDKAPRLDSLIDIWKPGKKYQAIRLIGGVSSFYQYWIPIKTKTGKITRIPKYCLDWNPDTESFDGENCPYKASGLLRGKHVYLTNAIIRDLQEAKPAKLPLLTKAEIKAHLIDEEKVFLKEMGSKSWTPIRGILIPASVAARLKAQKDLNTRENPKTGEVRKYDLAHPRFGRDIQFMYDPDAQKGSAMYDLSMGKRSPLTEEELAYLRYPLNVVKTETPEEASREWKKLEAMLYDENEVKNSRKFYNGGDDQETESVLDSSDEIGVDELNDLDDEPKTTKPRRIAAD